MKAIGTFAALCLALAGFSRPADAQSAIQRELQELQADDARLQAIAYRLVTANAHYCTDKQREIGILLSDLRNYSTPDKVRAALGAKGDFIVQAVAPGSQAAALGIRPGAEIVAIDRQALADLPAKPANDTARLIGLQDRIDLALSSKGAIEIDMGDRIVALTGAPACRARFEVQTRGQGASADARVVGISQAMLAETRSDDEAAFVVAHELAHVVLRVRARLAAEGRSSARIVATEREADRLAVWLMANGGYDPHAAPAFLRRWGPKGLVGLLRSSTHDAAGDRARLVEDETAVMFAVAGPEFAQRDWRGRFTPFPLTK